MFSEINDIHPKVNSTFEPTANNWMPFLDSLVIRESNNMEVEVYENQRTLDNIHCTSDEASTMKA